MLSGPTTFYVVKELDIYVLLALFFLYITKRISSDNFYRKRVRMLVPFRGQNQWSGTFDDVSNLSGLPETYLVPFRVFFAA